jgi:hypothetical protein
LVLCSMGLSCPGERSFDLRIKLVASWILPNKTVRTAAVSSAVDAASRQRERVVMVSPPT